jgi:hypothetical protein
MEMIKKPVRAFGVILRDIQPYFVKVVFGFWPFQDTRHQDLTFLLLCGKPLTASRFNGFNIQWRCFAAVYALLNLALEFLNPQLTQLVALFQKAQSLAHNLTSRIVKTAFNLAFHPFFKVGVQGNIHGHTLRIVAR